MKKTTEKEFNNLIIQIRQCSLCEEEFGFKPRPVVLGNSRSKIVQISQAPSSTVHNTLKPFTDMSGRKLKKEWYQIDDSVFYNPDNFYIASLSHCYPGKDKNGNDKSPPKRCYEKWLKKELTYIDNQIYIIIGAKAAKVFFPKEIYSDLIFKDNYLNGKLTFVLPHPSPLNKKWYKDNPSFDSNRIKEIRKKIYEILEVRND